MGTQETDKDDGRKDNLKNTWLDGDETDGVVLSPSVTPD